MQYHSKQEESIGEIPVNFPEETGETPCCNGQIAVFDSHILNVKQLCTNLQNLCEADTHVAYQQTGF